MALAGTLKDFGIADILQLIAQQPKTGVLHLRSKDRFITTPTTWTRSGPSRC